MNTKNIERKFAEMGARLEVRRIPIHWQNSDYALDIQHERAGQFFELRVPQQMEATVNLTVLQEQPREQHLLSLVRKNEPKQLHRFLCGHDEREWFVAAVPGTASTVWQAKIALQPWAVRQSLRDHRVPELLRHTRKNAAFLRQGNGSSFRNRRGNAPIDEKFVLRNEPIRRGAGKPHIVEELYRFGGEQVYVTPKQAWAFTEAQYRNLLRQNPRAAACEVGSDASQHARLCAWRGASLRPRHHSPARLPSCRAQYRNGSTRHGQRGLPRLRTRRFK